MKEVVAEVARLPACRIGCLAMLATVWIVGAGCHRESVITPEPTVVDAVSTNSTPVPESHEWTVSELRRDLRQARRVARRRRQRLQPLLRRVALRVLGGEPAGQAGEKLGLHREQDVSASS